MATTLILGGDRLALTMTKMLVGAGERVSILGVRNGAREALTAMLQDGVEKDIPFQFVDDIRHQQALLRRRLENIQFCRRISECNHNVKAVLATKLDSLSDVRLFGSIPIANFVAEAQSSNQVKVHLYQPIEQTKVAQIIVTPNTDPAAVEAIRLLFERCGIDEITREQADTVEALVRASPDKTSFDDVIQTILPRRQKIDHSHSIMH